MGDFDDTEINHLNGVKWHEAPIPRRWHKCWPQTSGWIGFTSIQRCPCGALRYDNAPFWMEKNSRKKEKK